MGLAEDALRSDRSLGSALRVAQHFAQRFVGGALWMGFRSGPREPEGWFWSEGVSRVVGRESLYQLGLVSYDDLAADLATQGARVFVAAGRIGPVLPLRVAGMTWRTATRLVPEAFCRVARQLGAEAAARKASASLWAAVQERHAGDLRRLGLGLLSRDEMQDPALWSRPPFTSEACLSALRRRDIELLPRLVALGEREAVLEGGRVVEIDSLLLATGFRHGLDEILPGLFAPVSLSPGDALLLGTPALARGATGAWNGLSTLWPPFPEGLSSGETARDLLRRAERWGEAEPPHFAGPLGMALLLAK